ncbi:immunoglobulin superfamily member 1 [Protobothrops mucrosquamatus]|uniref:immunoglobulin superfamily member 1 n=1 Tax=Protobothrops mucrosquamatus TaxID=103944 RepID=UPI0007758D77|nr:immunoglobulin superfamily member 1 [Protobothrops mucrosquamatus]
MRLIFNLFLGWWLTQHRWMAEGQTYRRPSISVNPSNVVAVGQNIIITCKKEENVKRTFIFYLYKGNVEMDHGDTDHDEFEFRIINAQESHQGQYSCVYKSLSYNWSPSSRTVDIYVRAQLYPSPSISVIPSGLVDLGKQVIIQCKRESYQNILFNFFKKGALEQLVIPLVWNYWTGSIIFNAQESNGGIYFCDYGFYPHNIYSKFSNKIYINITDPTAHKPSIYLEPKRQQMLGTNVQIYCQGPEDDLNYFFYKSTVFVTSQRAKPNSSLAEFSISGVRLEDIGNYSCCYQLKKNPFMYSKLSDPLQLQVRDPSLIKPSIQIINAEQDAPEANISIRCEGTEPDLIFALLKSKQQIDYKAAKLGERAVNFSLPWVKLEEAQNYTCQYQNKSSPFVWSVPSDPLERPRKAASLITLWTSIAAFLFLLAVLLLVLILILYRKRRKVQVFLNLQ